MKHFNSALRLFIIFELHNCHRNGNSASMCKNIQKTKFRTYFPVFDNIPSRVLTFLIFGCQKPVFDVTV